MSRFGGYQGLKWLRVYRDKRFNSVGFTMNKTGDSHKTGQPQPHLSVSPAAGVSGDVDPSSIGKSSLVGHYH